MHQWCAYKDPRQKILQPRIVYMYLCDVFRSVYQSRLLIWFSIQFMDLNLSHFQTWISIPFIDLNHFPNFKPESQSRFRLKLLSRFRILTSILSFKSNLSFVFRQLSLSRFLIRIPGHCFCIWISGPFTEMIFCPQTVFNLHPAYWSKPHPGFYYRIVL